MMGPFDADSAAWVETLAPDAPDRDVALARLHAMLLRAARGELSRRASPSRIAGKELDDLAHQVAADALMSITRRLATFRGESRFTTWAYKFVILEVSAKLGRHFWSRSEIVFEPEQWEQLPARLGLTHNYRMTIGFALRSRSIASQSQSMPSPGSSDAWARPSRIAS